jgi:plastocyanin
MLLAAACGGSGGASPTPTRQAVTVTVVAKNRAFDTNTIRVPANSRVTIKLENKDPDPHNIAVYDTPEAEQEIFVSDTISGSGSSTSGEFDAPPPGTYFFRCDVHPVTMTGQLIVE